MAFAPTNVTPSLPSQVSVNAMSLDAVSPATTTTAPVLSTTTTVKGPATTTTVKGAPTTTGVTSTTTKSPPTTAPKG